MSLSLLNWPCIWTIADNLTDRLEYLTNVLGLSAAEAKKALEG